MRSHLFAGAALLFVFAGTTAEPKQPDVETFVDTMVREHDFDRDELEAIIAEAEIKDSILEAIARPAEKTLSWAEYRDIFVTGRRIEAGADFWRSHRDMLERISGESGVPIEILVGIIGVETYYGRITGSYRVLDALTTLAFHYPPRADFFRRELEQYLLLTREEDMDAGEPTGSYAGAMGRPQFMPSSFRAYAVDSTGDGKRDIWGNWADVAGSVANYFVEHGWRSGESVTTRATLGNGWREPQPEPANTLTPRDTIKSLGERGVLFASDLPADSKSQLLAFEGENGFEYWVGFHNFFVITRYNRSVMYALAVHQLGREIAIEVRRDAG